MDDVPTYGWKRQTFHGSHSRLCVVCQRRIFSGIVNINLWDRARRDARIPAMCIACFLAEPEGVISDVPET